MYKLEREGERAHIAQVVFSKGEEEKEGGGNHNWEGRKGLK